MKTAVEWLVEQLFKTNNNTNDVKKIDSKSIIEQAKEIEKQQIIQSNRDGVDMIVNEKHFITGEQYYNETFKNK
jgi:uncharacterized protein (DUF2342 family)